MEYDKRIKLKDGMTCHLRNGIEEDAQAVYDLFQLTHAETDYLLSYPDENTYDVIQEKQFLKEKALSPNEIELLAIIDGVIVGCAGIEAVGSKYKVRHRAEFGISVAKAYWGLGIGRELMNACIECAKKAGYVQLELDVVADNKKAISMYESAGFVKFGSNPKGFHSKMSGFQELVYMRLEI